MMEREEDALCLQFQTGERQKPAEDAPDADRKAAQDCIEKGDEKPISVIAKLRTEMCRSKFSYMDQSFIFSDAVNWIRRGGRGRGFLVAAVGVAAFVAIAAAVAFTLLFISSTLNVAFASFLVTMSTIGFIMAFFFSSITVVYLGALGFGGLTIGSIAFFSVWALIILSVWTTIAWVIWQGLRKAFQFARHLAFWAGSFLLSLRAAEKLQVIGAKFYENRYQCSPMKSKKMAMDQRTLTSTFRATHNSGRGVLVQATS